MTAGNTAICEIAGGPRSASAKARSLNDRPPLLQWSHSTFCAKPSLCGLCTNNTSWALIERPYSCAPQAVGAVYDRPGFFVQSPGTGTSSRSLMSASQRVLGSTERTSSWHVSVEQNRELL